MSNEILFYDLSIQSPVLANKSLTPNTLYDYPSHNLSSRLIYDWVPRPVRYALNYKKLAYKTVWIKLHELEPVAKKVGAKATRMKPNG